MLEVDVVRLVDELDDEPTAQLPKSDWQPVPQCAASLPHQPALEQHRLGDCEKHDVPPLAGPHWPSVLGGGPVHTGPPALAVPDGPGAEPLPLRYQFWMGSPRQSPTVTER